MNKIDWKAKNISIETKISLTDLKEVILSLSKNEVIDLITDILSDGGKILKEVREWVNEE